MRNRDSDAHLGSIPGRPSMKPSAAIASLRYRDFRLIWFGQFVSILGTQIQTVALAWLVYTITGSAAALGVVGLARAVPIILLSMFGGTLADQVDRRRLLLVSQSVLASFSLLLAICVAVGLANLALLYGFAVITAAASAFDGPTRQAIIPSLVPRDRLANALTVNVLAQDTAAVFGPAVGGLVLARIGNFGGLLYRCRLVHGRGRGVRSPCASASRCRSCRGEAWLRWSMGCSSCASARSSGS